MSQDTSSQPDTRPNESDNVSEPPQKKRRCNTVVCSICLEDIPEMNILAHVQLCAYNHEKKHGLPHQCCPCGHKSTKNRTLSVSIDVTSDNEEQQLQLLLNKGPSYHEEPLCRARKNVTSFLWSLFSLSLFTVIVGITHEQFEWLLSQIQDQLERTRIGSCNETITNTAGRPR